jgi:hypothetical protein
LNVGPDNTEEDEEVESRVDMLLLEPSVHKNDDTDSQEEIGSEVSKMSFRKA